MLQGCLQLLSTPGDKRRGWFYPQQIGVNDHLGWLEDRLVVVEDHASDHQTPGALQVWCQILLNQGLIDADFVCHRIILTCQSGWSLGRTSNLPRLFESCYHFIMLKSLLKTLRPKQWAKNVFIFTALIFDRKLLDLPAFSRTLAGAVLFSLIASAVYIFNDIADLESDQQHPTKKLRPLASGELSIRAAWILGVGLLVIALPLAYLLSPEFLILCLVYFTLNLLYSARLKHIPLIDVMVLASFYVLRVISGTTLIEVKRFSPWLYVVTTLFALFIGLGKRRAELVLQLDGSSIRPVLEGYSIGLLDQLINIVSGTTIVAYSLYTFSAPNLPENHSMMLTIPFVVYGIFRYLYLIQIGEGGAPEDIALSDRPLQGAILLWSLGVLLVFYLY
jgi:4-hydroxybenzoate polyprenyltransferase